MAKWRLYAAVHGGKHLGEVEAATAEEAIEKGYELDTCYVSLCHQCSRQCDGAEIGDISADEVTP
jgi:hypothetical protein